MDKELLRRLRLIYRNVKSGDTVASVLEKFDINETELRGLIDLWNIEGKYLSIELNEDVPVVIKNRIYQKTNKIKEDMANLVHTKICVVSDTHLCSIWDQLTLTNFIYDECERRGITDVLHCGDLTDGDYRNRPDDIYNIHQIGYARQRDYVIKNYPIREGITTYWITGSHDLTHVKNGGGTTADHVSIIGHDIGEARSDMVFLGDNNGYFEKNNVRISMEHPGGGSGTYLSTKPQKSVKSLITGKKPNILLLGHFHKNFYMYLRNVHVYSVPALVGLSDFMDVNNLENVVGVLFLDIYSDKKGIIQYIIPEDYIFTDEEIIEDDYKRYRAV